MNLVLSASNVLATARLLMLDAKLSNKSKILMNDTFLRPNLFSDFVGQKRVVARIEIVIAAAKQRGEAVSHILLCGLPGLGKATLAYIIANAMGSNVKHVTDGGIVQRNSDLAGPIDQPRRGRCALY